MQTATKTEVGSPETSRPIAHGKTAGTMVRKSEHKNVSVDGGKVCPVPWCGCLSLNGNHCSNIGPDLNVLPCDPYDEFGRFTPREFYEGGQRFTTKDRRQLAPIIDAEDDLIRQTSSLSARDIEVLCRRQDELLPRTFTFRGMRITEEART